MQFFLEKKGPGAKYTQKKQQSNKDMNKDVNNNINNFHCLWE